MTLDLQQNSEDRVLQPDGGPPTPEVRKPYLWVLALLLIAGIAAGVVWWLMATTVPADDYETAIADLSNAETQVADLSAELSSATAENTELGNEIATLAEENTSLEAQLADTSAERRRLEDGVRSLTQVANAAAIGYLFYDPAYVEELRAAGLDETLADQLLADLAIDETYAEWLTGNPWLDVNRNMLRVPDEEIQQIWDEFASTEIGSIEEEIAYTEFIWRIGHLLLEPLANLGVGAPPI